MLFGPRCPRVFSHNALKDMAKQIQLKLVKWKKFEQNAALTLIQQNTKENSEEIRWELGRMKKNKEE